MSYDRAIYDACILQARQALTNLDRWLEGSVEYAEKKPFDPSVIPGLRLAPDQYSLARQVQAACDAAKSPAARLTGREPPSHPDTEVTVDELRARVRTVLDYLDGFSPEDFEGSSTREIVLPFLPGKVMEGASYLREMAQPNFFFHVTTAYAILRHHGMELGKRDFIGSLTLRDA